MMTLKFILYGAYFLGLFTQSTGKGIGENSWNNKYDYIIVGGGTAGCVLANRLSEDPDVTVLLLEAGPDASKDTLISVPRTWLNVASNLDYGWGFMSEPQRFANGRELPIHQSKLLGGGTSQNPMLVSRGSPFDFERWKQLGNKGWGYKDVLPYFKKSEDFLDRIAPDNEYRNKGGPWKLKTAYKFPMGGVFVEGLQLLGYNESDDYNGMGQRDFGFLQINADEKGRRSTTVEAYLRPVLHRTNLHVVTRAFVTKIMTKKYKYTKAIGLRFARGKRNYIVKAKREIIVSAGAINSPKLLMLSGIGNRKHLEDIGIEVVSNLPVGSNLLDHLMLSDMLYHTNKSTPLSFSFESVFQYLFTGKGPWSTIGGQLLGFFKTKSQPAQLKFPYLQLIMAERLPPVSLPIAASIRNHITIKQKLFEQLKHAETGRALISFFPVLLHPRIMGTVRLKSADPYENPRVTMNFLRDKSDVEDMIEGIRIVQQLVSTRPFIDINTRRSQDQHQNCTAHDYNSDDYWECYIRHKAASISHFTSSCRMAHDSTGVVDHELRVKGVKGLRVVDASVFPDIVSGGPMATTIMMAEKASDLIKNSRKPSKA